MTEFLRQICSLIKTSLPLLRPVYRNRHDQIRLPFPQFFLCISIHCSGIKITVFSASIVLISGNRSSHYAIINKNTSSLFIHMPVFLTVSAVFPCFYGFSTFITSGMTNRTKFFLAFQTDHPSLICQYFLTDRTASRVKNISNHAQIQGTDNAVFDNLQQTLEQFVNDRQWTHLQFQKNERINCNFNITVTKYAKDQNLFTCKALIQANRPVYNAAYTTTIYNNVDENFTFNFAQFDQLDFNEENLDNQLTALFAYYAYLIIGLDLDTFAPMGGEDVLQRCMNLTNNAQNLSYPGWKAFDDNRNRYAIIADYLDGGMQPFRQMQYDYYRKGLDEMANNAERGRTEITTTLETNLKKAKENKPLSLLPQIWTDYKKDELANIYKGKGTQKEKESIYELLFNINPSQNAQWDKIKQ